MSTTTQLEKRIQELELQLKQTKLTKKYGLVWEDKPEEFDEYTKNAFPVLVDKNSENHSNVHHGDGPQNILIEGDNYHSLSCLSYTHKGSIDLIYIDPPYNSGKKSWRYNNHYVEKDDIYRHSKWISYMNKRLLIAKSLLTKNGCLICAIDENEQENLGLLLRQIFTGYEVVCVTIQHNPRGIQGQNFSFCHEYAYFVHPKGGEYIEKIKRSANDVKGRNLRDNGGESLRSDAKNCFFGIRFKDGKFVGCSKRPSDEFHPEASNLVLEDGTVEIYPIDNDGTERKWRYALDSIDGVKHLLEMRTKKDGTSDVFLLKDEDRVRTLWSDAKYDANEYGSKLLGNIIGAGVFPFPKSFYTTYDCVRSVVGGKKDAVILDFFAGSGTTGHAVLEMNKEDGGNRQFILCTNNENGICEDVTYERIKRVMNGYPFKGAEKETFFERKMNLTALKKSDEIHSEMQRIKDEHGIDKDLSEAENKTRWKIKTEIKNDHIRVWGERKIDDYKEGLGGNLRYLKTDYVPKDSVDRVTDEDKLNLTHNVGCMIALKENTFDEREKTDFYQVFESDEKITGIYFKENKSQLPQLVEKLSQTGKPVKLYIFSWNKGEYKSAYSEYPNVTCEDIPEPILEVYKNIGL